MEYVVAVFINRSQSQMFSKLLNRRGIPNTVISTPRDLGVSCGLSVKFNLVHLNIAKGILRMGDFGTFKNFYKIIPLSGSRNSYIRV